jgi:hypothetical protein
MANTLVADLSQWVHGDFGPLLLLSASLLPAWEGSNDPSPEREITADFRYFKANDPATDYDRLCDVLEGERFVGKLSVGDSEGIAISQEERQAIWCRVSDRSGFICFSHLNDLDELWAEGWIERAASVPVPPPLFDFALESDRLYLFGAATAGRDIISDHNIKPNDYITIALPAGRYAFSYVDYHPEVDVTLDLFWLRST